jgi:methionyl-tRNA formyltransferase
MNIAIFTTKTLHHAFFVKELKKTRHNIDVLIEKKSVFKKFKTKHPIDKKTDSFEKKNFFNKKDNAFLSNFYNLNEFKSFNSEKFVNFIKKKKYDLVIVFGTGVLKKKLISLFKNCIFNLHGGNPEMFRGLDSIFWTIFHNQYNHIETTLHKLEKKIDTGKLFMKKKIFLKKKMKFYEIRYYNTLNCIILSKLLIKKILKKKKIKLKNQTEIGRYYTAMPTVLKDYCIYKFEIYTKNL